MDLKEQAGHSLGDNLPTNETVPGFSSRDTQSRASFQAYKIYIESKAVHLSQHGNKTPHSPWAFSGLRSNDRRVLSWELLRKMVLWKPHLHWLERAGEDITHHVVQYSCRKSGPSNSRVSTARKISIFANQSTSFFPVTRMVQFILLPFLPWLPAISGPNWMINCNDYNRLCS